LVNLLLCYFNLRQIEHISETGKPLFNDPLSYGGRTFIFLPLFHYILAFFNLFLPIHLVGKIIPNIFASSLVFVVYLLSLYATRNKNISLFTSFISIFIPIYITETINTVSVLSLALPLLFLMVYFLLEIRTNSTYFILCCFLVSLISPVSGILAVSLIVYLLLAKVEDFKIYKSRAESILFFIFIFVWIQFIVFKDAFLANGALVIWQNIPPTLLTSYFTQTNVLELMFLIGIIPFICGIYAVYRYFFIEKNRTVYVFTSVALTVFVLIFFRLLTPSLGAVFLGITLVILLAPFLNFLFHYLSNTKFASYKHIFVIIIFLVFLFNSLLPSFVFAKTEAQNIEDFVWIRDNTKVNSTVLAEVNQGHLISYISNRKNMMDSNFLMVDDVPTRLEDMDILFNAKFQTFALEITDKYGVDYIYTKEDLVDSDCFNEIKENIFEVKCK